MEQLTVLLLIPLFRPREMRLSKINLQVSSIIQQLQTLPQLCVDTFNLLSCRVGQTIKKCIHCFEALVRLARWQHKAEVSRTVAKEAISSHESEDRGIR